MKHEDEQAELRGDDNAADSARKRPATDDGVKSESELASDSHASAMKRRIVEPPVAAPMKPLDSQPVKVLPRDITTAGDPNRPQYRVMFTGIDDDRYKKMVVDLGGIVVVSSLEATHLVTDQVRRTAKFLCCLARGLPILTPRWLTASKENKAFTDHTDFFVTYKARDFGIVSLPGHLSHAAERPLLSGWTVLCTPKVLPPPPLIRDMVLCAGGRFTDALPTPQEAGGERVQRTTVIACPQDAAHPLVCAARAQAIPVVSHEFLLSGIMAQKLDLKRHLLK